MSSISNYNINNYMKPNIGLNICPLNTFEKLFLQNQ